MPGWFKRRDAPHGGELGAFAERRMRPQALAVAVAESVRAYFEAVAEGRVTYPAHRRGGLNVIDVWRDLRLEALRNLFNYGESEPFLLSDQSRQVELLIHFLDERPDFAQPRPRGEVVADTVQAAWLVYAYLGDVGSEVADRETDRATLRLAGRSILDGVTTQARSLRDGWAAFERAARSGKRPLPDMPRTLFEVLYEDVTTKAKSVALSAVFGPHYRAELSRLEDLVAERGGDPAEFRAAVERVTAAKDPDEFAE